MYLLPAFVYHLSNLCRTLLCFVSQDCSMSACRLGGVGYSFGWWGGVLRIGMGDMPAYVSVSHTKSTVLLETWNRSPGAKLTCPCMLSVSLPRPAQHP